MKYRYTIYPDGGYEYESFLDDRVPEEYKGSVVSKLPKAILDKKKELLKESEKRATLQPLIEDVLLGRKTLAEAQAAAQED